MTSRKTLVAVSTAIAFGFLGAGSVAQASDHDEDHGGFKIGPLGQPMGTPAEWGAAGWPRGAYSYGFVTPGQAHHPVHKHTHSR